MCGEDAKTVLLGLNRPSIEALQSKKRCSVGALRKSSIRVRPAGGQTRLAPPPPYFHRDADGWQQVDEEIGDLKLRRWCQGILPKSIYSMIMSKIIRWWRLCLLTTRLRLLSIFPLE